MSTKRKRAAETDVDADVATPTFKKKKGRMPMKEKEKQLAEIQKGLSVLEVLKMHRGDENRASIERFTRTPSRRVDPDYYKAVKNPIDFARIQQKLKMEEYMTFEQFCEDVELLINNAQEYYKEDSDEHKDASDLKTVFNDARQKVEAGEPLFDNGHTSEVDESPAPSSRRGSEADEERESSGSPGEVDLHMLQDVLCGILEFTDDNGRLLCPPFRVLQTKEEFPLYYEKISDPIDLKKIARNARAGHYKKLSQFHDDLNLLFRNAQKFSGKGTEIYRDADALMKFVKEKVEQVSEKGCHPRRREKVHRIVDGLLAQSPSAWAAEAFSEDSEEDEDTESNDDPRWKLYWLVRNATNDKNKSVTLSDPFLELPSKTYYPDYYEEIKTPVSMFMINKKLKRGDYENIEVLVKDLMQMYANACEYNIDGSDLYVAAKKLEDITVRNAKLFHPDIDLTEYIGRVKQLSPQKGPKTPKTPKIKMEIDFDTDSDSKTPPPASKKKSPRKHRGDYPGKPGRKTMDELMLRFRVKLIHLWDLVYNEKTKGGYWPAGAFMELPSYREYPDYYQTITTPIDMKTIRERVESNKYTSSVEMIADFKQMFDNARKYNEPRSAIYNDANHLQQLLETEHNNWKEGPQDSPAAMKLKFGNTFSWTKTKMAEKKRRRSTKTNGIAGASTYSDDESSNSSVRSPDPQRTHKKRVADKKIDDVISKLPPEEQKMWRMLQTMKDFCDEKGRRVSLAFMKLPTREEYPRYYEVIKKPMDLQRIQQRLNNQGYHTLTDLVSDMTLMLDNACRYNEPDSAIYKDAVTLQRLLLEMKQEIGSDESSPRVQVEIRTIFLTIFADVFGKKDENERCLSDSFVELPDLLKAKGVPASEWPFTFDQIKRNIDKCRYRRLDRLQKDFFDLFEKAREVAPIGSTLFEDAYELQKAFIVERDQRCKNVIASNAYTALAKDLDEALHKERSARGGEKVNEENEETGEEEQKKYVKLEGEVDLPSLTAKGVEFTAPCYAYVARTDEKSKLAPHILRIERIFKNENGDEAVQGQWMYRPNETLHLASRKFYTNEVFITPFEDTVLAERIVGKCCVVALKTFVSKEVTEFDSNDVYVCEWRYLGKPKYFMKIKQWPYAEDDANLVTVDRERPVSPQRTASEFLTTEQETEEEETETSSSSSSDEDDRMKTAVVLDIDRPEVRLRGSDEDADGRVFLQQMRSAQGRSFCIGQCVLVFNPYRPLCDIMRIDKLWREKDGGEWFSGGWYARPCDTVHDKGRMFYKKEVIGVNQADQTRKVSDIQSRCEVLHVKDYVRQRPTEIPECDVFVCESQVQGSLLPTGESSSLFHNIGTSATNTVEDDTDETMQPMHMDNAKAARKFKVYKLYSEVPDDELFFFKTPINMEKEMSPQLKNEGAVPLDSLDELLDDDTDGSESIVSGTTTTATTTIQAVVKMDPAPSSSAPSMPVISQFVGVNSQPKLGIKSKSGYILFSAEIRKRIMHENPDAGFGEVSKIVGIEWKKLSEDQKRQYEVRAEFIAAERAKQDAVKAAQERTLQPGQQRIYQCKWASCDSQFDAENGLYEHIVQHHTSQIIVDSEQQFVCMWTSCLRNRKDGKPFPSLPRLHRHMKEKHLASSMRNVYQNQIGRNFFRLLQVTTAGGESTLQLVNVPYGRVGGPPQQQHQQQQQQHINGGPQMQQQMQHIPQSNGHMMHHPQQQQQQVVVNGEHHHYIPAQHQLPPQQVYNSPAPSSSQQYVHAGQAQSQVVAQVSQVITDPGRTVVRAAPNAEPVFVAPPNSVHSRRVLHSEAYIKYIESMSSQRQKSVSRWDRSMAASHRNGPGSNGVGPQRLPTHWIRECRNGKPVTKEDDVTKALWRLRDELLQTTCNVVVEREAI